MSEADAKLGQEGEVPGRRWQMDELVPSRRNASDRNAGQATARSPATPSKQEAERKAADGPARTSPAKPPQTTAQAKLDQAKQRRAAAQRKAALEAERKKAREAGYQEGYREGLQAGQSEGHTQGHAEGHAQGLAQGREEARQELQQRLQETLDPVRNLATHFSQALAQLDDDIASELVELALATGRHLAGAALDAHPAQVVELVRQLLHSEPAMFGRPRLWLHPKDHALVSQALGQELEAAGWALQPDDQVSRGGCRVTSANGELDATWESRWESVRQQVRGRSSTSEIAAAAGELMAAADAASNP
ncbi:MAG: flagellar assembly protein FliH [Halochromatium sp.]